MAEKEYIERDKLIKDGWHLQRHVYGDGYACIESKRIQDIPAADVRPVVLCRDCQYCIIKDTFEYWCNGFCSPARLVCHDDFCSHGRKKDEPMCCL